MFNKQKFVADFNPATGQLIEKIRCATRIEITAAVKHANKAAKSWPSEPLKTRIKKILNVIEAFEKQSDTIARLITDEIGKVYKYSKEEVRDALESARINVELAEKATQVEIHQKKNLITEVHRVPVGIIAVITPWNFPFDIPLSLIIPAILMGNSVVFKPSEHTPLVGRLIAEVFAEYLPKGVINLLHGGGETGQDLINCDIDMVAFVGSRDVGKSIMQSASKNVLKLLMELGGKDAMIIAKDADLEKASDFAVRATLFNCGRVCPSVERIYVEHTISLKFERLILDKLKKIRVGNPYDSVDVGPMINDTHRMRVIRHIEESVKKGARLIYGGTKPEIPGYYLTPALIIDATEKHEVMKEETFGPVIAIQRVKNIEEAIEKNNKLKYGLGATIWTKNMKRAKQIAQMLEVGMIGINCGVAGVPGTPWVGIKQSGFGFYNSIDGIKQFTYPKKITFLK
ncbi:MAG: aldehyde dehydrogenase family protein [Ignavibacteria bacterium]